ncbi:putative very long-chain acyl-CoA synthetase-like [Apostichopus japonicus]|uniref:Very long-chain fatty acid transport protein n=1 Tax=Stichopus japonicus TaxID=307972 RepID=A0A2G8LMY4_STIJA|nr:putative very long-chain acyl-CoA synthetase-like [Apostichopus japonicus]
MVEFGALKKYADVQYLTSSLAVVYNHLRRRSPEPSQAKMFSFLTSLITYIAYGVLGISVPSLIVYILYPAITDDFGFLSRLARIESNKKRCLKSNFSIIDKYESQVKKQGTKTFLHYENQQYSYADVNKQANRIMHYLVGNNEVKLRDVVCLLMYNEPGFVWAWLGIIKCGATAALVNTHIRGKSLLHCIKISAAKKIICGSDVELIEALKEIKSDLDELGIEIFVMGFSDKPLPEDFKDLTKLSLNSSDENDVEARKGLDLWNDNCVYIYTSGTTGLPKATRMAYRRLITTSTLMMVYDMAPDDVFYLCLPLYHSAAFGVGLMNVINSGAAGAIRKKFSVREFWRDIRQYRVTIIQYIGETARYLVQAPRSEEDGVYPHGSIRMAVGNGLPADIWEEFQTRFNIKRIGEYYGASEGNFLIMNFDGKLGTVGRYTPLLEKLLRVLQIIECDMETAEPKRGPDGLCVICPRGKAGLLGTKISNQLPLDGYIGDKQITEKKIIRDVLQKGDAYFNTGDLMLIDENGYVYFKDRLGNTFRWKGENVATTEVELSLLENPQVESANVYGVQIEGKDGRAGMASLILRNDVTLDCPALYKHITERLPSYACPKFVRIKESIEVTGTYKHRKVNLIKEGFDPKTITDPLYYMNDTEKTYSPLDEEAYNHVLSGAIRM